MRVFIFMIVLLSCGYGVVKGLPVAPEGDRPSARDVWTDNEADDDVSGANLMKNILEHAKRGHVTQDVVMHWMKQIQDALSRGSLTTESVQQFIVELKQKLAENTAVQDYCCVWLNFYALWIEQGK